MGVSFDSALKNAQWAAEESFNFELWSDTDRTLALTYGAATSDTQAYASRITVILNADGDLVLEYLTDINVGTHPNEVYDDCVKLFGS